MTHDSKPVASDTIGSRQGKHWSQTISRATTNTPLSQTFNRDIPTPVIQYVSVPLPEVSQAQSAENREPPSWPSRGFLRGFLGNVALVSNARLNRVAVNVITMAITVKTLSMLWCAAVQSVTSLLMSTQIDSGFNGSIASISNGKETNYWKKWTHHIKPHIQNQIIKQIIESWIMLHLNSQLIYWN